ncbi:MAG: hypothetical protein DRO40_01060 [Thermoprotei archaeon]|nr:MAG: hypothetical protein DRO40_01060 [Thermoprotei archaeon]
MLILGNNYEVRMNMLNKRLIAILIILAIGLIVRCILAPFSTGSDIAQFAGFADTFLRHGFCFYNYADASHWIEEKWPYNWPYNYGPIWIYVLGILRLFVQSPIKTLWHHDTYIVYVPTDWIVAVKSVLIFFDTLVAILLYKYIRERHGYVLGILALTIYYLNPMTIYISAIYGMFDQLSLFFLMITLICLDKNKFLAGIFASLSLLTKHVTLLPILTMILYLTFIKKDYARFLKGLILSAIIVMTPIIMFCPHSIINMFNVILFSSEPNYTYPIAYSFNGISSIATLIHDKCPGCDTLWLITSWYVLMGLLYCIVLAYLFSTKKIVESIALSYIVFTATYWRVNHQYLILTIAFLIILFAKIRHHGIKLLSIFTALYIGLWPIFFPVSWWFHAHIEEPNKFLWRLLDSLSAMIFCDVFYALYSLFLTLFQYVIVIGTIYYDGRILDIILRKIASYRK